MLLQIDDETRIKSTDHGWQVEYRRTKHGEAAWTPKTYHLTFGQAVSEAVQREIRRNPADTLTEAIEAVDQIARKYERVIDRAAAAAADRVERLAQFE
ncbi:MAG: hypothetical protein AAGF72_05610 [Pseudomonadota bacterium]